jgi:UDP-3-O-[3-hydroxymyristoyl] glucosamine N-acyltransferase
MTLKLSTLVEALAPDFPSARLVGDPELLIHALSPLEAAKDGSLCFLSHPKYAQKLVSSKASCVVVGVADESASLQRGATIVVADPYYYFARLTQVWKRHHGTSSVATIHPTACIDASARVDPGVSIGAFAYIAPNAVIAEFPTTNFAYIIVPLY